MVLDLQTLFNTLLGGLLILMGVIIKTIWDAVQNLKSDLTQIEVALPKTYVAKDEFRLAVQEIKDMLGKIFDKLDGKVDK